MPATDHLTEKLIRHITGVEAYTMPSGLQLGLMTQTGGIGGPINEVSTSGTGYTRKAISFQELSPAIYENTLPIIFECSGVDFGSITHYGIWDGGGNRLWSESVIPAAYVGDQDSFLVSAGEVRITLI